MLREGRRPRGEVRLYRDGKEFYRGSNLFVNAGLPALAKLLAGVATGEYVIAIGFGDGGDPVTSPPTVEDIDLFGPMKYYKPVYQATEDGNGNVTFAWQLVGTAGAFPGNPDADAVRARESVAGIDFGAFGMTVSEIGLFGNLSGISLPGTITPAPMIAHALLGVTVEFFSGVNIASTWTLSF
jgi:hypothetical protein